MDVKILAALLLLSAAAFSTIIEISVAEQVKNVVDYVEAREGDVWKLLVNVENIGSAACPARLKLETQSGKFWTKEILMEPGQIELFTMPYLTNETEEGKAYLHFCDNVQEVGAFNISPTSLLPGNVSAKAFILGNDLVVAGENITAIPITPRNMIAPISHVDGIEFIRVEYGKRIKKPIKVLVFNSTHYSIIEARPYPDFIPILKIAFIGLAGVLIGLVAGRFLNA